jgi:FixJ family two-component response regulator
MPASLIVDVNMPEMTGLDLQSELLRLGVHIPTIVITATDDETVAGRSAALGAKNFLFRPLKREALMKAINSIANPPN